MIRIASRALLILLLAAPLALAQREADLPIERVVLFASGVGFVQHSGTVSGDGHVTLHLDGQQLDDVLKSLLAEDLGGGSAHVVTFPSRGSAPSEPRFALARGEGLTALFRQLVGSEVELVRPEGTARGRLLGVERMADTNDDRTYLSLIRNGGVELVQVEGMLRFSAADPALQAAIETALAEVERERTAAGGDPLRVAFRGSGTRQIRLGYIIEQPLWKTSYRLALPSGDGRARLQGWAVVENRTDRDWDGISLSLVSGRPISFITPLAQPVMVRRQRVDIRAESPAPVPVRYDAGVPAGTIRGRVLDQSGQPLPGASVSVEGTRLGSVTNASGEFAIANVPRGQHSVRASYVGFDTQTQSVNLAEAGASIVFRLREGVGLEEVVVSAGRGRVLDLDIDLDLTASPRQRIAYQAPAVQATAADIGDYFEYNLANISVPRGEAAMVPIISGTADIERFSIYDNQQGSRHPLRAIRVTNRTTNHLQAGPATIFDNDSYAGDVFLPDLPPGDNRIVSYAADLDVIVTENLYGDEDDRLVTGIIEDGVLTLTRRESVISRYTIENRGSRPRAVIVQHARGASELVSPSAEELTPDGYRFRTRVPAGGTATLTVREEEPIEERLALVDGRHDLQAYASARELPAAVRTALRRAAELHAARQAALEDRRRAEQRLQELQSEQARLRENVTALPADSPFVARQLARIEEVEDAIGQARERLEGARRLEQDRQRALTEYLRTLSAR